MLVFSLPADRMEAIRSIQTVENGTIYLQLPQQFWGQEVEIIVRTLPPVPKKSLRGSLSRYANPDLVPREQEAWQASASENYDPC